MNGLAVSNTNLAYLMYDFRLKMPGVLVAIPVQAVLYKGMKV